MNNSEISEKFFNQAKGCLHFDFSETDERHISRYNFPKKSNIFILFRNCDLKSLDKIIEKFQTHDNIVGFDIRDNTELDDRDLRNLLSSFNKSYIFFTGITKLQDDRFIRHPEIIEHFIIVLKTKKGKKKESIGFSSRDVRIISDDKYS